MTENEFQFVALLMEYESAFNDLVVAGEPQKGKERAAYARAKRALIDFAKPFLNPKAVIDRCDMGHTFAKARIDGVLQATRCPLCLAIGLDDARRQIAELANPGR